MTKINAKCCNICGLPLNCLDSNSIHICCEPKISNADNLETMKTFFPERYKKITRNKYYELLVVNFI